MVHEDTATNTQLCLWQLENDFATVSSEAHTAAVVIAGHTQLLLRGHVGALTAEQREWLQYIYASGASIRRLFAQILLLHALEAARVDNHTQAVELVPLLEERLHVYAQLYAERHVIVTQRFPAYPIILVTDRELLCRAFEQLLDNAYRYIDDADTIRIELHILPRVIHISITDTGSGIAPDNQSRLFRRWTSFHRPTLGSMTGAGLGLAITKHIMAYLHGEVTFAANSPQGSIFTLVLPYERE